MIQMMIFFNSNNEISFTLYNNIFLQNNPFIDHFQTQILGISIYANSCCKAWYLKN